MPFALVPLIDIRPRHGRPGQFFRAPVGFDQGGNYVLLGKERALIWTPNTLSDGRAITLADAKEDTLLATRRTALANFLGDRTFQSTARLLDIVTGMLLNPPSGRWNGLRPSRVRQRFEVFLGPDQGKLFWSQPQVVPNASVVYPDNFDRTNGDLTGTTSSGGHFTWAQVEGGEWEILSNTAQSVDIASGMFSVERTSTDVDTADYYVQFTFTNWDRPANQLAAGPALRGGTFASAGHGYAAEFRNDAGTPENVIYKWDDGSVLDTEATIDIESVAGEVRIEADGSTIRVLHESVEILSETDTEFPGDSGERKAAIASYCSSPSTLGSVGIDDFETGDLAGAPAEPRPPLLHTTNRSQAPFRASNY